MIAMKPQDNHILACICGCGRTAERPKYLHAEMPHWLTDERTEDDDKL